MLYLSGRIQFNPEPFLESHASDLGGIATVLSVSALAGILFLRLKQPPIVGYILGGVVLGPTGFGLVSATEAIELLAELGVVLLLFLIGMELSLKAFQRVLKPALITVAGQIAAAFAIAFTIGTLVDWPAKQSLLIAFILAVSSTAVAMTMLDAIGELRTAMGRITVGVLIAQDIAVVPMIILIDSFAGAHINPVLLATKMIAAGLVLTLIFRFLGRWGKLTLPFTAALRGRDDLVAVAAIAYCFAAAAITATIGLSAAFGAFVAGLIIANSTLRQEAIAVTHPIQSVLVVIFFLSIGLLIDLDYVMANIGTVLLFVFGVLVIKSLTNIALLRFVGEPWERAFPVGLIMAQIGEFSFVLAAVGVANGTIDRDGYRLAVTVIALSLLISPLWMSVIRRFHAVAHEGLTDFRAALAESYQPELEELGRGTTAMRRGLRRTRIAIWRRRRAFRIAIRRRRERRTGMARAARALSAAGISTAAPMYDEGDRTTDDGTSGATSTATTGNDGKGAGDETPPADTPQSSVP